LYLAPSFALFRSNQTNESSQGTTSFLQVDEEEGLLDECANNNENVSALYVFCAIALVATVAYNYAGLALSIVGIAALSAGE
jgi:hypothetical protein